MSEKNSKTKKKKGGEKRTFGVKAPSFKLQAAYGKEGRGGEAPCQGKKQEHNNAKRAEIIL
jgi:hypothetical protein